MEDLENYTKEKLTINLVWANVFSLLMLVPTALLFWLPFEWLWKPDSASRHFFGDINPPLQMLLFLAVLTVGVVLHELLHGLTWSLFTKNGFKSMKFGVLWKSLTPYCHCKEPLQVRQYVLGALAPAVVLGVLPCVAALVFGHFGLLCFGMLFIVLASGDLLIILKVRKLKPTDMVLDHPSEAGCYVYRKVA